MSILVSQFIPPSSQAILMHTDIWDLLILDKGQDGVYVD